MEFEPLPRMPRMAPQSSSILNCDLGSTPSPGSVLPGSFADISTDGMKCVAYGAPDAYAHVPLITQPSSAGVAVPVGAATHGARNSPSGPNDSACACSSKYDPRVSA